MKRLNTSEDFSFAQKKPVNLEMKAVSMIINARWVVPVVPANTILENHSVVIEDERIIDILPTEVFILSFDYSNLILIGSW